MNTYTGTTRHVTQDSIVPTFKVKRVSYLAFEEALVVVGEQRGVVHEKHNRGRRRTHLKDEKGGEYCKFTA